MWRDAFAYSEEQPLQHFTMLLYIRYIWSKLALLIKHLSEVQQDSRRLEYGEAIMRDCWNTTVRVEFEEPRRLDLVVDFADVRVTNGHGDSSVKATLLLNLVVKMRIHTRIQDHCTEP